MQKTPTKSPLNPCENNGSREHKEKKKKSKEKEVVEDQSDDISDRFQCINIAKRDTIKRELTGARLGLWRQEQKSRAAKMEKQLKARRELDALIEEQLNRFHAHYNQSMVPSCLEDVSQLIMPRWAAPQELATLSWLGDWRPSAILELLHCLDPTFYVSNSSARKSVLSELINEIRIEEAIIDEEMAEIQATCVLYLPFAPVKSRRSGGSARNGIQAEFKKISRVIIKAQKLRFKTLELVVKKVMDQADAAQFLVAFSGIQDAIHQYGEHQRLRKQPVTVTIKPQDVVETLKQSRICLEDRNSFKKKSTLSLEQESSRQGIQDALDQNEEQQRLLKGPDTMSVKPVDVVEISKLPMMQLEDRIRFWQKISMSIEQESSSQGNPDVNNENKEQQEL